jgi:hypothetical protein
MAGLRPLDSNAGDGAEGAASGAPGALPVNVRHDAVRIAAVV